MASYVIRGGQRLSGQISISGNKNSILPCLAATLLTNETVILKNVPSIKDVEVFIEILEAIGAKVTRGERTIQVNTSKVNTYKIPQDLARKLRASILFIGPLLARFGKVEFFHPGGDLIGKRSIDSHLNGLGKLGYVFFSRDHHYLGKKISQPFKNYSIFLEEASVTATENLILASVLGTKKILLKNCATEPHIVDLCLMLNKMGAKIVGVGSNNLSIKGTPKIKGTTFNIGVDYIEMGTYAVAAAITDGDVTLTNCSLNNLDPVIIAFEKMGIRLKPDGKRVKVVTTKITSHSYLKTNIWPGFPTDLMSALLVLATQANGVSLLHDWMYESRMFFVDKLISMGAKITIADPHRVLVSGKTKLTARNLETPDIRAGMALVLAALVAKGESRIDRAELIERGYEDTVGKLSGLGARISRVD